MALALGCVAMTSCTDEIKFGNAFIEKAPGGTVTIDTVFNSAEYTKQFLTAIYSLQYYGLPYRNEDSHNNANVPHSQCDWNSKLDALTDCYHQHFSGSAAYNQYYVGSLTSASQPLISYTGDLVWKAVREAWTLIENVDNVSGLSDAEKASMAAQAKCLIASRYFDLFSVYGGLPIIDHTFTGTESSFEVPRASIEKTVNFMVKLLDEAIPNLRWAWDGNSSDTDATNTGRWTAAGAMALKAKILLIAASPLYNADRPYYDGTSQAETDSLVWYGDFQQSRWERALQACQAFMDANAANGNYYQLWTTDASNPTCDNYRQAYRKGYIAQESHEVIHATRVATIFGTQSTYRWWNFVGGSGPFRASYGPTQEYVDMFPWSDGTPFDWDKDMEAGLINGKKQSDGSYNFEGKLFYENKVLRGGIVQKKASRDPRLYENAIVNGMNVTLDWTTGTSTGNVYELWVGGAHEGTDAAQYDADGNVTITEKDVTRFPSGYGTIKYWLGEEYHRQYMHWVYLSYDEMLLMYAEALAQCGRLSDAITQIDKVRARVGLGGIASCNPKLDLRNNKANLIEEILRERACELGMSNNRYYDMIRYKRTDWMTKQLHGLLTFRLMKNSSGKLVRVFRAYIGDDKTAGVAQPSQFEFERFELQNIRRILWGLDSNDLEVRKWLLFPFPLTEINKGYGLVQNPGW